MGDKYMKSFEFKVTDALGIHARPAGMLAKEAKAFADTTITVTKGDVTVKASQLMKLMSLAVKCGDTVTIAAEGPNEDAAIETIKSFFEKNL